MKNTDFNEVAWAAFIHWAIDKEDICKQFEEETGTFPYSPPKTGLEALIDKATGFDQHPKVYVRKFIIWATENLWGLDYATEGYWKAKEELSHEPAPPKPLSLG